MRFVEDQGVERLLDGLHNFFLEHDLYGKRWSFKKHLEKGSKIIIGAHNAGNDAVVRAKVPHLPWTGF